MSIRQHPTRGPGFWQIDIGRGKARRRIQFEGSKAEAQEIEDAARMERGTKLTLSDPRVREVAPLYLKTYEVDHLPAGIAKQKEQVSKVLEFFGPYSISSITPTLVEAYKRDRSKTVKPSTINKELSALRQICVWAQDAGMINVLPRIKRYPPKLTKAPTPRIPTPAIMEKILAEINPRVRDLFRLSFMAGLRPGEAVSIKRDNWIPELSMLAVTGKGNKIRHIPIVDTEMASELTRRAKDTKSGYLWESPWTKTKYADIRGALKEAAKRAGWNESIHHHLLRHAAATDLIGTGTDVSIVQQIMGHSTIKVTEGYLHIRHSMMIEAMKRKTHSVNKKGCEANAGMVE